MSRLYNILKLTKLSVGPVSGIPDDFEYIYPKSDGYIYHASNDYIERRLQHELSLGKGLTQSSVLEDVIAPYGSILSLNISGGLTFSGNQLVVGSITASQISTGNTASVGDVLTFDGNEMTWSDNNTSLMSLFGISCGVGYTGHPTYSLNIDDTYLLGFYCLADDRSFQLSSAGGATSACALISDTTYYHNGNNPIPTIGNIVYIDVNKTVPFNGAGLYYKAGNNSSIQISATGSVTDLSFCS